MKNSRKIDENCWKIIGKAAGINWQKVGQWSEHI